jgi:hypothetical protein
LVLFVSFADFTKCVRDDFPDAEDASVAAKDARNGEPLYYHRTASRTRVDIIRI